MPQQEVIFTRGVMGSGKSTAVQELLRERPQLRKISRDDLRGTLFGDYYEISYENEELITRVEYNLLRRLLREGYDVIIDNLNIRPSYLSAYFREFQQLQLRSDLNLCFQVLDCTEISLAKLLERNQRRNDRLPEGHYKRVPLPVVERSFERLQSSNKAWWAHFKALKNWEKPERISFSEKLPPAILIVWEPTIAEQAPWLARLETAVLIANPEDYPPISWRRLGIYPQLLLETPHKRDDLPMNWLQQIEDRYFIQQILDKDYYRGGYWLYQDCNLL